MNVRVMSVLRPSVPDLFTATKPEHARKNGGKAIGRGFREAGAGGSNPLFPTIIFAIANRRKNNDFPEPENKRATGSCASPVR